MRITPLDIRKQEFRRVMRGLDTEEVQAFLATVADEYEAVLNDNKALKDRLLELDDKVQEYRNMEKTLRNTLLTAERVTVEAKENARREADLIIKEAQIEAEKTLRTISNDQAALRNSVQELKRQKESYIARIRMVAEAHLKFIESAENDMRELDDIEEAPARDAAQPEAAAEPVAVPPPVEEAVGEMEPEMTDTPQQPAEAGMDSAEPEAAQPAPAEQAPPPAGQAPPPVGQAPPPARAAAGEQEERLPDLNEILERLEANRRDRTAGPAPQPEPASVRPLEQPVAQSRISPAEPAMQQPAVEESRPAAPADNSTEEWSLDRLKRDILSGASDRNENT